MRKVFCIFICVLLAFMTPFSAFAEENTLILETPEDLLRLAESCRLDSYSLGLTVRLENDLDLTGVDFEGIPSFSGTFDGRGYRITGLELTQPGSQAGFFRYLTREAVVRDLSLEGIIAPTGSRESVGALAGHSAGLIENCSFSGSVSGSQYVGGLVGKQALTGIMQNCSVSGSIQGSHFVGGLAGENAGVIRFCQNSANVNTLLEQNSISLEDITLDTLTGSESAATVTDIGGIAGTGSGVIRDCENLGDVGYPQIGYNVGGITGSTSGYLYRCRNTGAIRGRKEVGGICGQLEPAMNLLFTEDTIQTLQDQMGAMSGIAGALSSHAKNGVSSMTQEAQKLNGHVDDAKDALAMLAPKAEFPFLPDLDTVQASKNALTGSISGMNDSVTSMASIGKNTLSVLSSDVQQLASQLSAIGSTVSNATENLGGTVRDVSHLDTPEDMTAKLRGCYSSGPVSGDWNIGGIVGAMAIENDLDPDSDLDLFGELSLNFDMELRCAVVDCQASGDVSGGKENLGGIVGWMSMGLVSQCLSTSNLAAPAATYTGGIAGTSLGTLQDCIYRGLVVGKSHVGGIAGEGDRVTGCASVALLESSGECVGAILGTGNPDGLQDNRYLVLEEDPGALDGISYAGLAQPLDRDAFFALPGLPQDLNLVTVTFSLSEEDAIVRTLPFGTRLTREHFPQLPAPEGNEAHWDSPLAVGQPICRDITVKAVYTPHSATLASQQINRQGLPLALLQGDFLPGAALSMEKRGTDALEAWELVLPESAVPRKLRYLLPEGLTASHVTLWALTPEGWQELSFTLSGSYLVSEIPDELTAIELRQAPRDLMPVYLAGAGTLALILVITVTALILRRRKKARSREPAPTE